MNYDRIPHLYRVSNVETGEVWELFAKDNLDAICKCPGGPESDPFTGPFRTQELLTPEGYRIYRLKDIPKGSYFCRCKGHGGLTTNKTVWVKGEYNRSARQYEVYKFEDVNRTSLRNGTCYVTIDMTF